MGVAQKNLIFGLFLGQKWALAAPQDVEDVDKKLISGQKTHFWAQKGPLWAIGAKKRPAERPNDHLPENQRYPELPQDMGDM